MDTCIYHFPCDDGFASAWVARRQWPRIAMFPTNYGQELPPDELIVDREVLIADFSYKPDVLHKLAAKAKSIVVLDHHKTAQADLADFYAPNVHVVFDMERSGAVLTWHFCLPGKSAPRMIELIQDRDLWKFSLASSRRFSLFLRSFPYDFSVWTTIADGMEDEVSSANMLGKAEAIERFYDQKIAEIVPTATFKQIGKWNVPVAHAPYAFASDLAHELLKANPHAPFAAVIVDAHGGRTYSLRSEDHRQDVSEVARLFGGGGHRNAAGFRVP